MSHPARLSLRAPPHLPFIQGFPGIPPCPASATSPERKPAGVHGTLELRIGHLPVKAKWVRVELRKHEILPAGFPGATPEGTWEHVGAISTLWQPPQGKEWDSIETADFKFFIPLPENIPPSVELPRSTGVRYELVAAMCYRQKGGLFKKESSPIVKSSEWLLITKHELHSAWPIYQIPDSRTIQAANGQINLTVSRPSTAFGSGDRIQFTATLKSAKSQPFKLKGFECTLLEVVTSIPLPPDPSSTKGKKRKSLQQPIAKTRPIGAVKAVVDETVGLGGEKSARIELHVDRALVTVKHARTIEVGYELEVKAVTDGLREKVEMGGIVYIVGPFARAHAQEAVKDIGYVEALCPDRPRPASMQSTPSLFTTPPGSGPNTPPISNVSGHRPTNSVPYAPVSTTLTPRQSSYGAVQQMQQQQQYQQQEYQHQQHQRQHQQQQQQQQGFIPRQPTGRPSSITTMGSDSTSTTHPAGGGGHGEFGLTPMGNQGQGQGRLYQTMPNPQPSGTGSASGRRNDVAFPSPQPSSPRPRSVTPTSLTVESGEGDSRYTQSEMGPGGGAGGGYADDNKRYSSMTTATFGRWDKGLKKAMGNGGGSGEGTLMSLAESDATPTPTSPTAPSVSTRPTSPVAAVGSSRPASTRPPVPPPSAYMSAEAEKRMQRDRYELARTRTVASQLAQGNSLDTIGLSPNPGSAMGDMPDAPPPEYAPPRPKQPDREYTAPRPLSTYASLNGSPTNLSSPASGAGASPPLAQGVVDSASPPRPPTHQQKTAYASAEQEKETQRRRYEDAIARTESPSVQASASGSGLGSGSGFNDKVARQSSIITALKSDAPLRTSQGVSLHDSAMPPSSSPSATAAGPSNPATVGLGITAGSGLSEKEQMRRFYEAQDRVAQAANKATSPGRVTSIGTSSVLSRKSGGGSVGPIPGSSKDGPTSNGDDDNGNDNDFAPGYSAPALSKPSSGSIGIGGYAKAGAGAGVGVLSEKEQMRRYYEAQDRVAAAASGPNSVQSSPQAGHSTYRSTGPSAPPPQSNAQARPGYGSPSRGPTGSGSGSALSEKEQMRRYYEAQDRVAQAQRGEGPSQNGMSTPPRANQSTSSSPFAAGSPSAQNGHEFRSGSALDEKEQMRRYYEAQDRVAQASSGTSAGASGSGSASGSGLSAPEYQVTPPRPAKITALQNLGPSPRKPLSSSSRPSSPSPSVSMSASGSGPGQKDGPSPGPAKLGAVISAIDEKEQMRRYYEAMDRVQQASSSTTTSGSAAGSRVVSGPTGQSSESPSRIARQEGQYGSSSSATGFGSGSGFSGAPMVDSPPAFEFSSTYGSGTGAGAASSSRHGGGGGGGGSGYPFASAADEKEAMRRRYESATAAVERHASPSPSPPLLSSSSYIHDHDLDHGHDSSPASAVPGQQRPRTSLGTNMNTNTNANAGLSTTSSSSVHARVATAPSSALALGDAGILLARPNTADPSTASRSGRPISQEYEANPTPESPVISRDPTIKAGKAKASSSSQNELAENDREGAAPPPPPLPARPPKEYVRLLSPVGE
ncbi:hypothetical protein IAT40_008002 [Kwoniella sp. CBS 6097]